MQTIFETNKIKKEANIVSHKRAAKIQICKTDGLFLKVFFKAYILIFYPQVNVYGPIIILENNTHKERLTHSYMYHGRVSRCRAYGGKICCTIAFS